MEEGHSGQNKKDKRINNDVQQTTQKTETCSDTLCHYLSIQ